MKLARGIAWMTAGFALAAFSWAANVRAQKRAAPLTSLEAREVNIVDEHGNVRLRLGAPLPMKIPQGGERRNPMYGIQFLDSEVGEVGGIVSSSERRTIGSRSVVMVQATKNRSSTDERGWRRMGGRKPLLTSRRL